MYDPVQRRAAVVRHAAALIVEGGLAAVTFRKLAAAMNCSTTIISHHFRDKEEVLLETYRHVNAEAEAHRIAALAALAPSPLRAIEELLPVGEAQRRHWTVWLHYWTAALHDPQLAAEHAAGLRRMFERIRDHLTSLGQDTAQAEIGAQTICNALYGIAMQAIFDRERWTAERQRSEFRRACAVGAA